MTLVNRIKSKKAFIPLVFLWGLIAVLMPAMAMADVTSTAQITVSPPVISATDAAGAPVVLDWTTGLGVGFDTRGSKSGVSTTLTGTVESHNSDYSDPGWQNTYITASQGTLPNAVTGRADTHSSLTPSWMVPTDPITLLPLLPNPDRLFAASNIALQPIGINEGSVFAEAVLSGQFTVLTAATLTVSATYAYLLQLFNGGSSDLNYADVIAGLYLYDFAGSDPLNSGQSPKLTFSEFFWSQQINGLGSYDAALDPLAPPPGTLNLTWNVVPGVVYDFEAFGSVDANAATVPEPISMVLLGTGMLGLAILRKRFA
jgi:hypothetical protein